MVECNGRTPWSPSSAEILKNYRIRMAEIKKWKNSATEGCLDHPFTWEEFSNTLQSLRKDGAPGLDRVTNQMIQEATPQFKK